MPRDLSSDPRLCGAPKHGCCCFNVSPRAFRRLRAIKPNESFAWLSRLSDEKWLMKDKAFSVGVQKIACAWRMRTTPCLDKEVLNRMQTTPCLDEEVLHQTVPSKRAVSRLLAVSQAAVLAILPPPPRCSPATILFSVSSLPQPYVGVSPHNSQVLPASHRASCLPNTSHSFRPNPPRFSASCSFQQRPLEARDILPTSPFSLKIRP